MEPMGKPLSPERKAIVLLVAFLAVLAIGWLDRTTGAYLSFALFYLLPIGFVAWILGRWSGFLIALGAMVVGLRGDLSSVVAAKAFVPYWNAVMRLGVFALAVVVLDRLRISLETQRFLARTDPLTESANPRWFAEVAEIEIARARRYGRDLSLAYIDLDHFKSVNDTSGHSTGDEVLRVISSIIASAIRPSDLLARIGGDEFALLLPETPPPSGRLAIVRIRELLLAEMARRECPVTFSVGIAGLTDEIESVDQFIAAADALMYQAKEKGKDRIVTVDEVHPALSVGTQT